MNGDIVMIVRRREENLHREGGQEWEEERGAVSIDDMMWVGGLSVCVPSEDAAHVIDAAKKISVR